MPCRRACNPLQYSCLENPMDRGAWWAVVYRVAKHWRQLRDWAHTHGSPIFNFLRNTPSLLLGFLSPQIFIYKILFYFLIFGFKRLKYQTTWPILRNLNAGQEAIVRTGQGTTNWFQIRKGVCQGCILLPCLFNLYAEYIMWNAGLEQAQAAIKSAGRDINNLRYAYDTALMAESEEELKSFLMKMRGEWKSWLKTQHS